jgi:Domain of unknown function (DUF4126)
MDYVLPVILGVSLAAAAGFRIFVPLLVMGLAARAGYLPVGETLAWVATAPALLMLAVAAIAEVIAYYIPGVDNLLDTLATPAAVIAGISMSAAVMTDLPPMLKWTLAIIAGGGAAGLTQTVTTLLRGASTATTAGLGNPVIATMELIGALTISVLAFLAPWIALLIAVVIAVAAWRFLKRRRKQHA